MLKTHSCGELRREDVGQQVTLAGWVNRRRDMGGVVFIDLRDRDGKTQVVVNSGRSQEAFNVAEQVRGEYVLQVRGGVHARPEGMQNPDLATGEIEVLVDEVVILNPSKTPPFLIDRDENVDEPIRLKYRYLDLRRERLQRNITVRHKAIKFIREFLNERDFIDIETPILFKSTPEGARDYLVPSRVHPGKFYALPQSPQQLKQLLMIAGFERYYQIARCFRDEDLRADRQPEFTQLDLEVSFVERNDILELIEALMIGMVKEASLVPLAYEDFPRLSYAEAVDRYGTDRPDIRFGLELIDVADIVGKSAFRIFAENVAAGKPVKAICVPNCGSYSRKQLGELEDIAKEQGARGLAWMAIHPESEQIRGPIVKFFSVEQLIALTERLEASPGDLVLFASDEKQVVNDVLSTLRVEMASRLGLMDKRELAFLDTDPGAVLSEQYDLVCNGYEVAGGSIRIHERPLQRKIMQLIGFSIEDAQDQFGHLLEAFEYGAPPHGGIAPGIDRLVALMAGEPNIREVMAFPKTAQATDLMSDSPSEVATRQLKELHIALAVSEMGAT
jgi:aspartyl-tRNA synthetase